MKHILLVIAILFGSLVVARVVAPPVHAQVGIGFSVASSFSTTVAGCPASHVARRAFLCIVVPGGTAKPSLALSVAGAPMQRARAGIAIHFMFISYIPPLRSTDR